MTIGKALAVVGAGVGAYTALDKVVSGKFWWEKPPFVPALQLMQTQAIIRMQVQAEFANREKARLAKEKQASSMGKYRSQSTASIPTWTNPSVNYGLSRY